MIEFIFTKEAVIIKETFSVISICGWDTNSQTERSMVTKMSTLENTISMMKTLPDADLIKIQDFIRKLFLQQEHEAIDTAVSKILKPMSKDDFINDVKTAEKEIANGKCKNAEEVFDGLEQRYGF